MNEGPSATVGSYLSAKLRALDARLADAAKRVVAQEPNDGAVHDLRVALRRTRTLLEIGRPVFGPFRCDEVRGALRDVQRATGTLRDEEVLLDLAGSLVANDPLLDTWLTIRRRRELRMRRALVRLIEAGEMDWGRRLLDALLAFRVDPSRDGRLEKFARRAVAKARRRVERQRMARLDDPSALHRLRIACKRLRYVVESLAQGLSSELAALAHNASRLQSRLGSVHDVDVAVGCVRRARSLSPEARQALLAALARAREERVAAYAAAAAEGLSPRLEDGTAQASGVDSLRKTSTR